MNIDQLTEVAYAMVEPGKGILAADERAPRPLKKRFDATASRTRKRTAATYREFMFPHRAGDLSEAHLGRDPVRR